MPSPFPIQMETAFDIGPRSSRPSRSSHRHPSPAIATDGGRIAILVLRPMGELTGTGSQEDFDLVVPQCHHKVGRLIAVQIVASDGNGSPMHGIPRPFFKFPVFPA